MTDLGRLDLDKLMGNILDLRLNKLDPSEEEANCEHDNMTVSVDEMFGSESVIVTCPQCSLFEPIDPTF